MAWHDMTGTCATTCMYSTQQLLLSIFVLRFVLNIEKVVQPYVNQLVMYCTGTGSADTEVDTEERQALNSGDDISADRGSFDFFLV